MRCAVCSRRACVTAFPVARLLAAGAGAGNGHRMGTAEDSGVKKIRVVIRSEI